LSKDDAKSCFIKKIKEILHMFCPNCGANVPNGNAFCPNCGANVQQQQQQQQAYQQPYQQPYQQQPYQQQPYQQPYQAPNFGYRPPMAELPGKGLAITGMVLGIISLVTFCVWYLCLACGITAIILSAIAINKAKAVGMKSPMALAGLICSCIGIALMIILYLIVIIAIATNADWIYKYYYYYY
jgi:hypothetical protein